MCFVLIPQTNIILSVHAVATWLYNTRIYQFNSNKARKRDNRYASSSLLEEFVESELHVEQSLL